MKAHLAKTEPKEVVHKKIILITSADTEPSAVPVVKHRVLRSIQALADLSSTLHTTIQILFEVSIL